MKYSLIITSKAIRELEIIPEKMYEKIVRAIHELQNEPRPEATLKLKGSSKYWRIRVGDYRILYAIHDSMKLVTVFRVVHRKDAYR